MVSNAVFLCERLHAASPGEHTTHLIWRRATTGRAPHRARAVPGARPGALPVSPRAVLLRSPGALPEAHPPPARPADARTRLPRVPLSEAKPRREQQDRTPTAPNGAAGFHLLGLVCNETEKARRGGAALVATAMSLDPSPWTRTPRGALRAGRGERGARRRGALLRRRQRDGGAHAGYPTLRELGGTVRGARTGETPATRGVRDGGAGSNGEDLSDLKTRSTHLRSGLPRAPGGADSAAPPGRRPRDGRGRNPGPARDLRLDERERDGDDGGGPRRSGPTRATVTRRRRAIARRRARNLRDPADLERRRRRTRRRRLRPSGKGARRRRGVPPGERA